MTRAAAYGVRFLVAGLLGACGCASARFGPAHPVVPRGLRIGDTVAIVAPAYPLDPARTEQAVRRLTEMGFRAKLVGDLYTRRGYLAGRDEARAQALMAAYRDPNVRAILCGTGGYGTTRILEHLDFDVIRRNPKILVGFSDVTALHLAIQKETGQITFHGPNLMWGLGSLDRNLTPFASAHLWRAVCTPDTLEALRKQSGEPVPGLDHVNAPGSLVYDLSMLEAESPRPTVLRPGRARGRLTGGNLSLVCALAGTRWEIDTRGRILFLEDVGEDPYRIDRFLRQLKQAGKLDGVAGVILGCWHKCVAEDPEKSLSLDEVFADYFTDAPYPVVAQFPVGHVRDNATLPVGALAELDADAMTLRILEPTVR